MYLHLNQLKARILPAETSGATRFDERLRGIAEGVAAMFDCYTGRKLVREVGRIEDHPGGVGVIFLQAPPVEVLTTLTISYEEGDAFEALGYDRLSKKAGIIRFDEASPGDDGSTIRATYTGGYWVDTSEDLSGTLPNGATAIPGDLLDAWVMQVDHECRLRKVFGGTQDEDIAASLAAVGLVPRAEVTLKHYFKPC